VKVVLGVTGCIAAYKAVEVMRGLQKAGASVRVILTRSAKKFVAPLTFEALSGKSVLTNMFPPGVDLDFPHIRVVQEARLLAVVPATANILGKFAHGIADDLLSTVYLSCAAPVLLAPAMNVEMWNNQAVRENVETLRRRGHHIVEPEAGMLACGTEGEGRLADVGVIVARILELVKGGGSLAGLRVLVTAGPTVEDIDPVRFLSNRSSGKMGYAVASAARLRGAAVVLVSGPTALPAPAGVEIVQVRSASEMKEAVLRVYPSADIVVKAAAVSDYRSASPATRKIKRGPESMTLALTPNDDILALLGDQKKTQVLIGFAAETGDIADKARGKMMRKNLDLIVANDVSDGVFGQDSATVHIMNPSGESEILRDQSKLAIANRILDIALGLVAARGVPGATP
jgi:phosphopantothenoylcysteine decarboxylase/phosphopantothenate--cysteine ligase